jgi:Tol biopolymer transport system component
MLLTPGTRLGPYEIVAPLGAGGMGEVYRARDTRLGRDVAVKVLPTHLSEQPEIRARFEREAKTVSSLNHPNICSLFDVGREGDVDYLVLELVEGDTLAERLARGPLPGPEMLRLGAQIADALDRAHRAGVVHRDLKPGNVMLTRSGAKLLDFGLARATGLDGSAPGSSSRTLPHSPTMGKALTAEGTILGTFQYMAPEQLEGREADARSDIWALGCVLYEMCTGRRAFEGRSQASLIAAILEREPAPVGERPSDAGLPAGSTLQAQAPPHGIERLIRNCLAKDPEERIQTAHDVKLQLQGIAEGAGYSTSGMAVSGARSAVGAPAVHAGPARGRGVPLPVAAALGAALVLALAGLGWLSTRPKPPGTPPLRFRIEPPPGTVEAFWPRISPDGRYLLVQSLDSLNVLRAWVRPLDQIDAVPIPGSEGLQRAYWSPDSREVVFMDGDELKRVPIAGGMPVVLQTVPNGADLSWGSKGMILIDGNATDSLRVVAAGGGDIKPATRIDRAAGEIGGAWPIFLPDGERFLFIGSRTDMTNGGNIRLGRLGTLDSKLLGRSDGRVEYAPGDWILFLRGTTLVAQKLDVGAGKLVGEPIRVADDLRIGGANGHFSVSTNGLVALALNTAPAERSLFATDRRGTLDGPALLHGPIVTPRVSPDGRRLLYQRTGPSGLGEAHVFDLDRRTDTRLTFTGETARNAQWSPDGRRFAYQVRLAPGQWTLRIGSADGLGVQDSVPYPSGNPLHLWQWSGSDSSLIVFTDTGRMTRVPLAGSARLPQALLDTTQFAAQGRVSPDGRWLAYVTGRAPNVQMYVNSLRGEPGRWQISTTTGIMPEWTRGGRELVFETMDGRLMAVDIETESGFRAGIPVELFRVPMNSPALGITSWAVSADGNRFFLLVPPRNTAVAKLEVLTDFARLVGRR